MSIRIAVSGSGGFIGRHVVARLELETDVQVVRVLRPGVVRPKVSREDAVWMDVLGASDRASSLPPVDVLVHLAWSDLDDFRSEAHMRRVADHERFIRSWLDSGVRRVIGVGTCLEYGLVEGGLTETMPLAPVIAYARAKAELSTRIERLAAEFSADWSWARIFYPFGDGQHPRSLWTSLHAAIDRGDASFPMSGGMQVRDYMPVIEVGSDLARLALAEGRWGPVNICSGRPVVLKELVDDWIQQRGSTIRPHLGVYPYPDYEPMGFWGSRRRLERIIGEGPDGADGPSQDSVGS